MQVLTSEMHERAMRAANLAVEFYIEKHGQGFPCGFSWVCARVKGNTKLGRSFMNKGFTRSDYLGGYIFDPVECFTQDMYAREAGTRAYVEALSAMLPDVQVSVRSQMD